jgi:SAM-dependent methyltransferase
LTGRALELGAREGGLSLWLALKGCDVVCSEYRWSARRLAGPLHQRYGITVTYEEIDATTIPYESAFDLIVFKSLLGALHTAHRQVEAIASMHHALKPGGLLLFAENLAATPLHRMLRRSTRQAYPNWRDVTLRELRAALHRHFSEVEIHTAGLTSIRWLDHVPVPASWRYMAYGVARR